MTADRILNLIVPALIALICIVIFFLCSSGSKTLFRACNARGICLLLAHELSRDAQS